MCGIRACADVDVIRHTCCMHEGQKTMSGVLLHHPNYSLVTESLVEPGTRLTVSKSRELPVSVLLSEGVTVIYSHSQLCMRVLGI